MCDHSKETLKQELREALEKQTPVLRGAAEEILRRQAATVILEAVTCFLKGWDAYLTRQNDSSVSSKLEQVCESFSILLSELGPGDTQMRETLLKVLPLLEQQACRQVIFDFLPATMPLEDLELATNEVIRVLRDVLLRDQTSALLPVLRCLSVLPMSESGRSQAFQVAQSSLPKVTQSELPTVIRTLLLYAGTEEEARSGLGALRAELCLLENELSDVSHVVLASFANPNNGKVLVTAYLKILLKEATETKSYGESSDYLFLDVVVLLALSQDSEYSQATDRILDKWLAKNSFPFKMLDAILLAVYEPTNESQSEVQDASLLYNWVAPSLLRHSVFLLLGPIRGVASKRTMELVQSFVLNLFDNVNQESRAELVKILLHLGEGSSHWSWDNREIICGRSKKQKGEYTKDVKRTINQSINAILRGIVHRNPCCVLEFKDMLVRQLMDDECDIESVKELCSILAPLVSTVSTPRNQLRIDISEAITMLQKLLFSSPGVFGCGEDRTQVVKGILLATELMRVTQLCEADRKCIKAWVLQVFLPSPMQTVDPEIGSLGLAFLKVFSEGICMKDVFGHLKTVLASTGLVQVLSSYKQHKKKDHSILGYTKIPIQFAPAVKTEAGSRDMVFCVSFFLKHHDLKCPQRWKHGTQWVFDLVDNYLRAGREKTRKGWSPHSWLQAAIEFPRVTWNLEFKDEKHKNILNSIKEIFFSFELDSDGSLLDSEFIKRSTFDPFLTSLNGRELTDLQDSVFLVALSILIAMNIAAAVLRNSFLHFQHTVSSKTDNETETLKLRRLILFHLAKIYHLKAKLSSVRTVLNALQARRTRSSGKRMLLRVEKAHTVEDITFALSEIHRIESSYFSTETYINPHIFWISLVDTEGETFIRNALEMLASKDPSLTDKQQRAARRVIELKTLSLQHLVSMMSPPFVVPCMSGGLVTQKAHFLHCVRSSCFIIDILPKLRKGAFAVPEEQQHAFIIPMRSVVLLAVSYLRVLLACLSKVMESLSSNTIRSAELVLDNDVGERGTGSSQNFQLDSNGYEDLLANAFESFLHRLVAAENPLVANSLMEVISSISLRIEAKFMNQTIEASWTSLHTVYAHVENEESQLDLPYAFRLSIDLFLCRNGSKTFSTLKNTLDSTLIKVCSDRAKDNRGFAFLRQGILRHWGLLMYSPHSLATYQKHFCSLASKLDLFLDQLSKTVSTKVEEDWKESDSEDEHRKPLLSSIPGLTAATSLDYFELLIFATIGATVVALPSSKPADSGSNCGPYHSLSLQLGLFCKLVDLFKNRFSLFPGKALSLILHAARHMLAASTSKLQDFVEWRNCRPLLSSEDKAKNIYDPGAMKYIENLLGVIAPCTAGCILSLCDFLQETLSQDRHKIKMLRYAAEKSVLAIKDVSLSHNLPPPSFASKGDGNEYFSDETKGFHQMVRSAAIQSVKCRKLSWSTDEGRDAKRCRPQAEDDNNEDSELNMNNSDDDLSSMGSFGISGDWGDDADDDDSLVCTDFCGKKKSSR